MQRPRPTVDIVVPFAGNAASLAGLLERLAALDLQEGDALTVVDNRPPGAASIEAPDGTRMIAAPERASSYYARNRGSAEGDGEWILFLDADVEPAPNLVELYF